VLHRMCHRDMEHSMIILPRSQAAHLAPGCHHWVCVGAGSAMIDGVELCAMCAQSIMVERQTPARSADDGQQHD
jgi:hypothetical protein